MPTSKILIADDHPVFLFGLKSIINLIDSCEIQNVASDGKMALSIIRKTLPDIAVLDIDMPEMNGIEVTKRINKLKIPTKVIILTMHKDESIFNLALDCGAMGYVLKDNAALDIVNAIIAVNNGNIFISPQIIQFKDNRENKKYINQVELLKELTETEKKILVEVSLNKSSIEIAYKLNVSNKTIQNHRFNICKKLNLKGINSLLSYALINKISINLILAD